MTHLDMSSFGSPPLGKLNSILGFAGVPITPPITPFDKRSNTHKIFIKMVYLGLRDEFNGHYLKVRAIKAGPLSISPLWRLNPV